MLLAVCLMYFSAYFPSFYLCLVPPYIFCFHVFMFLFLCCFLHFSAFLDILFEYYLIVIFSVLYHFSGFFLL